MSIRIIKSISRMQKIANEFRINKKRIALVPTMGYLHKGHTALIEKARSLADIVITSIFVNPKQFGPNEDYKRYPRDINHDKKLAKKSGADIIFYPSVEEMYPDDFKTYIEVEKVSDLFEGKFRPNHFKGVATIVAKLFNITKPHVAIFGQKDAQQAFIIKRIIKDLNYDIKIIVNPIIRDEDGLALSSRNTYLSKEERKNALVLSKSLKHVKKRIKEGERSKNLLLKEMHQIVKSGNPTKIDYISFIDPESFTEIDILNKKKVLVALAVRFGKTRLIDNTIIKL